MTDSQSPDTPDMRAAEYALGLLDGAEWAAAHALVQNDPAFADKVSQWQIRGDAWLRQIEPDGATPQVWQKLASLFGEDDVIAIAPVGHDPAADITLQDDVRQWRRRAYLAMAASLALAFGLGLSLFSSGRPLPRSAGEQPRFAETAVDRPATLNLAVAQIVDSQGKTVLTALFDPENRDLWVNVADLAGEAKALELWALDDNGQPLSLGLVEDSNNKRRISHALGDLLVTDRIIAVTLEDRATAPHAAPTGDILGTARLKFL